MTRIRVISLDVGGGFGLKGNLHPEEGLVLGRYTVIDDAAW